MAGTCFGLETEETYDKRVEDFATNVGIVAYLAGTRPSSLFEWNEPLEWADRLTFDIEVGRLTWKVLQESRLI